jgi:hypothetical protein
MKATRITECAKQDCPSVYVTDAGTVLAQGRIVTGTDGVRLGPGEVVVELPLSVFREAAAVLGMGTGA